MLHQFRPSRMLVGILALFALGVPLAAGIDCAKRPPKVSPLSCCPLPDIITDEVMERCKMAMPMTPSRSTPSHGTDLYKEMSDEVKSNPAGPSQRHHHHHRTPHGHHMHSCLVACVLNETGIMMSVPDAKLNEDKLSAYLKIALVNSTDIIPVMESSFKTCAARGLEIRSKIKEIMQKKNSSSSDSNTSSINQDRMMRLPRHQCPHAAGHLMRCVFMESVLNCPASMWSNTADCNEMRDFMKSCKPKFNDKSEISNSVEEM